MPISAESELLPKRMVSPRMGNWMEGLTAYKDKLRKEMEEKLFRLPIIASILADR